MSSTKKIIGIALVGALATGMAHAGNVQWSVAIGLPVPIILPGHVHFPVVVAPAPVVRYYEPAPVVRYYEPVPVVQHRHHGHDRDGDGIPNRYDRVYNPRWDRDGDGIPNWRDHHDDRRVSRH
jgi:hypothetical protein